ncbi:MAG: GNAT family N-acetyltransferase [Planctomycetota bacterium]
MGKSTPYHIAPASELGTSDEDLERLLHLVYVGEDFTDPEVGEVILSAPQVRARGEIISAVSPAGDLVGIVILVTSQSLARRFASENDAELHFLAVDPDHRRHGLGRRLVVEVIERARSAGLRSMFLWTQPSMKSAHRLYAACGFTRQRKLDFERDGREFWVLNLDL